MIIEAIIIGLILSKILGGKYENILDFKLKGIKLLILGVFISLFLYLFTSIDLGYLTKIAIDYYVFFHIFSLLFIIAGLLFNYKNLGIVTIAAGLFLNLIPIILNGKMPVSAKALAEVGNFRLIDIISSGRSLSHGIFMEPKAYFLSDILPLKPPYIFPKVISLGDIVITLGLILAIVLISRRKI
ncbi:DUF5317 domain-containing protein [Anaerosphaera multitolerans]|uniref:DUF5317 domain-containing protein n=1 Tax=Anaerosphaera multitolerans TaxID=2487351 RepID=A0A437S7N9_9FIRM|nr:DUF5317 domain-containing protein [Anaerosphaera multitolerans]RVU54941.1 hypothetical protein EF514_04975 [Anaerosphaera multitolerans]